LFSTFAEKRWLLPLIIFLQVVFCAGSHGWEDIENNRRIYAEAVGEAARLGKAEV
jgi:hypothetical protein